MDEWEMKARDRISDALKYKSITVTMHIEAATTMLSLLDAERARADMADVALFEAKGNAAETLRETLVRGAKVNADLRNLARELAAALEAGARSLETLASKAGKEDELLGDITSIRGYAHSRASVARDALARAREAGIIKEGE